VAVRKEPVRVEFFGLLPTLFAQCESCMQVMQGTGMEPYAEQLEEYPEDVKKQYWELSSMANGLKTEFGDAVFIDAIDAVSPRGVWTSIRLRIAKTPCIIIQGKKAFGGIPAYEELRKKVRLAIDELVRS
jgi:hypothetical protein